MSGEIERTLEISNQSIINAAVEMSDIHGITKTNRSVVNANIPPRPERVNVKVMDALGADAPRQYSPISRPSSADNNGNSAAMEGLAYIPTSHGAPKAAPPTHAYSSGGNLPSPRPCTSTYSPTIRSVPINSTTIHYPKTSSNSSTSSSSIVYQPGLRETHASPVEHYTPLPRADLKPYHESYFTDANPPILLPSMSASNPIVEDEVIVVRSNSSSSASSANHVGSFIPEGLAASLQARVLGSGSNHGTVPSTVSMITLPMPSLPAPTITESKRHHNNKYQQLGEQVKPSPMYLTKDSVDTISTTMSLCKEEYQQLHSSVAESAKTMYLGMDAGSTTISLCKEEYQQLQHEQTKVAPMYTSKENLDSKEARRMYGKHNQQSSNSGTTTTTCGSNCQKLGGSHKSCACSSTFATSRGTPSHLTHSYLHPAQQQQQQLLCLTSAAATTTTTTSRGQHQPRNPSQSLATSSSYRDAAAYSSYHPQENLDLQHHPHMYNRYVHVMEEHSSSFAQNTKFPTAAPASGVMGHAGRRRTRSGSGSRENSSEGATGELPQQQQEDGQQERELIGEGAQRCAGATDGGTSGSGSISQAVIAVGTAAGAARPSMAANGQAANSRKCADEADVEVEEEGEESKWQDRISSGFDRLVAFASTELDKRRRSTEGSDSCNTSPDSGIGHGNTDLSSASSSSSSLIGAVSAPQVPQPASSQLVLQQSVQAITTSLKQQKILFKMPTTKSPDAVEPPPRTPSPNASASVTASSSEPPPILHRYNSPERMDEANSRNPTPPPQQPPVIQQHNSALMKYQRSNSHNPPAPPAMHQQYHYQPPPQHQHQQYQQHGGGRHDQQHFKKKFYYREHWREDRWQKGGSAGGGVGPQQMQQQQQDQEPARDRFRPKGKDWNWHKEHISQQDYQIDYGPYQ